MNSIDNSLDLMDNTRFLNQYGGDIRHFSTLLKFTEVEITSIFMVYHKFVIANGKKAKNMTKKQFHHLCLTVLRIFDIEIINRIISCITVEDNNISKAAWMRLVNIFLSEDLEVRMNFAYEVYTQNIGQLGRNVVSFAVEKFFPGDDDEANELRSDMVEFIFSKFDIDKDGVISYDEYVKVVRKQPMLVEFLGQVFPSREDTLILALILNLMNFVIKKEN